MSLYSDSFTEVSEERLPTLRQYIKAKKGKNIPKKFLVRLIWVPNKFPSYSIETEHFRASVGKDTAVGKLLKENWDEIVDSSLQTLMAIEVEKDVPTAMRFYPGTGRGKWVDIGQDTLLGIRWENE